MVISRLTGGLGNQLFQYAAGRRVALANNTTLGLDISSYQISAHRYRLDRFNISAGVLPVSKSARLPSPARRTLAHRLARRITREIWERLPVQKQRVIREHGQGFDPEIPNLPDGVCLSGYWQSEKYFADIADVLRREFTVVHPPDAANREMAQRIKSCESVSLHIRRGDYVSDPTCNKVHGTCPPSYYDSAVGELAKEVGQPALFVFSDDLDWARQNLKIGFPTVYVDVNGPQADYEDLRLMSLCTHHIIANSTFSWWGAWLAENPSKIVYAPKRWFQSADADSSDIVPETWRRL